MQNDEVQRQPFDVDPEQSVPKEHTQSALISTFSLFKGITFCGLT